MSPEKPCFMCPQLKKFPALLFFFLLFSLGILRSSIQWGKLKDKYSEALLTWLCITCVPCFALEDLMSWNHRLSEVGRDL